MQRPAHNSSFAGFRAPAAVAGDFARPFGVKIFSDFDGTISRQDSLKLLLERHGGLEWRQLERALKDGTLAESEALPQMFRGFPLLPKQAQAEVLAAVELDSSFGDFAAWCLDQGHELTILSGGFRSFIIPLLTRYGLGSLNVIANDCEESADGGWTIRRAPVESLCRLCTHCKSASLLKEQKSADLIVYIGDGHTDYCPVQLAHLVFAKGSLKDHCHRSGQSFMDFDSFKDVLAKLEVSIQYLSQGIEALDPTAYAAACEKNLGYRSGEFLKQFYSIA